MEDTQAITYRRLVASLARELSAEEVEQVAYIRLTGKESISKYTSSHPNATGIALLATLERLGMFSQENAEGLVDIAKDIKRHDLVKKIEDYRKNKKSAVKCAKKKKRGLPSEEQKQLEETFEMMVTQFSVLEQHVSLLQRALDGEQEEEALEVLRGTAVVVQGMGSKLSEAHERLARRSPDSSNSSDGGSSPCSVEDTAPKQDMAMDLVSSVMSDNQLHVDSPQPQQASPTQKKKPVATPRKLKNLHLPIQETVEQSSATAQQQPQLPVECEDNKKSRKNAKPPITPRRCPPTLKTKNLSMDYHMPPGQCTADSDEDVTGDSGMGTGSGSAQYEDVETWRQALDNPPPGSQEHMYQSLSLDSRVPDCEYQGLQRKPKMMT